jgi:hypothetical protein
VSLDQYLDTSYSPDREYVDGVVVDRCFGERPHSRTISNLVHSLAPLNVFPTLRVRTTLTRCRVPDICVTLAEPQEDVLTTT